jgi:hypothetical protein
LDPLLYRGGYDRRDERGGSGYDRKDYGRRDDRGYERNEHLNTDMFDDLMFIFASLKVKLFCLVKNICEMLGSGVMTVVTIIEVDTTVIAATRDLPIVA